MIFVTVGTHEQPFDRLIRCIDNLKATGEIQEDVIIQTGFSTYEPEYCQWERIYPYKQMEKNIIDARIVVTHGGPSSFIMPLQNGKIPIVMPRQKQYNEHVNDHQVEFCEAVTQRFGNIIVAKDDGELKEALRDYDEIIKSMPNGMNSHNEQFNLEFEKMVRGMF